MSTSTRRRAFAAVALAASVGAGLVVHGLLPDSAATDIAGDALYAAAVYAGLVLILPGSHPLVLAAVAAAWCIAVELLQLTGLPAAWSAATPLAALVFGSAFDARDLVVYVTAVAAASAVDAVVRSRRGQAAVPGAAPGTMEP